MGSSRTRTLVLTALLVVLAVVVYRAWTRSTAGALLSSSSRGGSLPVVRPDVVEPPDVRLEQLQARRPEPGGTDRNLFRFGARQPPPAFPLTARPPQPAQSLAPDVPSAASAAPIALKFIGIVEAPNRSLRLAILSDERGIYHGREGDIIEGRYRIVTIGVESIEMSQLDGSGRQTIRLSGS